MNQADWILLESCRSYCYRLFADCFYPPVPDELLKNESCLRLAAALEELYPETIAGPQAKAMHRQLSSSDGLRLQADHAALFVGPFHLLAPPYGSVYLEEGYALMGQSTLNAQSCYAAEGLTLTALELPDHITVELEFMHYLSSLAARALEAGDESEAGRLGLLQGRFLVEHLGAWAPAFCSLVQRHARTAYFAALAECLRDFVAAELRQSESRDSRLRCCHSC